MKCWHLTGFHLNCIVLLEVMGFLWVLEKLMEEIHKWSWWCCHLCWWRTTLLKYEGQKRLHGLLISFCDDGLDLKQAPWIWQHSLEGLTEAVLWGPCYLKRDHTHGVDEFTKAIKWAGGHYTVTEEKQGASWCYSPFNRHQYLFRSLKSYEVLSLGSFKNNKKN